MRMRTFDFITKQELNNYSGLATVEELHANHKHLALRCLTVSVQQGLLLGDVDCGSAYTKVALREPRHKILIKAWICGLQSNDMWVML